MKFSQPAAIRRLAIFAFHDEDGVVDDYIPYLLEDLTKNIEELLIVCNGSLGDAGRAKLSQFTSNILVRAEEGLDVWAYKEGMAHYGWDKLGAYDEVVLGNFTLMGPLYPFRQMFEEMSRRDLDFWGISWHYGLRPDPWGKCKYEYIPKHIPSDFMVYRSSILKSPEFQRYWQDMPMIHDEAERICWHEGIFTEDFTRIGFISDVHVQTEDLKDHSEYPLMLYPTELIARRKCPIFKLDTFIDSYDELLDVSCGQAGYELYKYLAVNTHYDLNLIWATILRTANMADIKERMQLNYVLPTDECASPLGDEPRTALFMHIYYTDQLEYCKGYAASMPAFADIYLTTDTEEKKAKLEEAFGDFGGRNVQVLLVENRGREIGAHFIGLKPVAEKYEYVCFAHDKTSSHLKPAIKGESFSYHCFESILTSPKYVENVLATFQNNPRLGLLVPPTPIFSDFIIVMGDEWQANYENVCGLAKRLGLTVDIDRDKPPIAPLGGMYWYRTKALKALFAAGFTYDEFPEEPVQQWDGTIMHAIERVYAFAAQQAGYYTGWLFPDEYSKLEFTNLYKILGEFNQALLSQFGARPRRSYVNLIKETLEKEKELQRVYGLVNEKDEWIQVLTKQVTDKEQEAQTYLAQFEQTKILADSYAQSMSWKITKPLRKLKDMVDSMKKRNNSNSNE